MNEPARIRIGRVTLKGGTTLSILPTRPAPDDSNFVPTLVWILEQARLGRVAGYAGVFSIDDEDGTRRCIEFAKVWGNTDRHHVLGLIRRMEVNYMARTWEAT